jgi:hypothetical protein
MPETPVVDEQALEQWFAANVGLLVIIAVLLLILYAFSGRIMHAAVSRAGHPKRQVDPAAEAVELDKRAGLSSLATAVLRIVVGVVTLVIGFFGCGGLLAGAGLFLAALTLARPAIVLDYLMGILIILEGHTSRVTSSPRARWSAPWRTSGCGAPTVRSVDGTVHSLSNGGSHRLQPHASSRQQKSPSLASARILSVLDLMDAVGRSPWIPASRLIIETPSVQFIGDPDDLGMTATMRGKVLAGERWTVATIADA